MKRKIHLTSMVFLTLTLAHAALVFSSGFPDSLWYEPSGMQYLAIILLHGPILVIGGLVVLFCEKERPKGRTRSGKLAIYSGFLLALLALVGSDLADWMKISGTLLSGLLTIIFFRNTSRAFKSRD